MAPAPSGGQRTLSPTGAAEKAVLSFFFREREPGWYRWSRNWGSSPVYDKVVDGQVAVKWQDGVEHVGVLPHN